MVFLYILNKVDNWVSDTLIIWRNSITNRDQVKNLIYLWNTSSENVLYKVVRNHLKIHDGKNHSNLLKRNLKEVVCDKILCKKDITHLHCHVHVKVIQFKYFLNVLYDDVWWYLNDKVKNVNVYRSDNNDHHKIYSNHFVLSQNVLCSFENTLVEDFNLFYFFLSVVLISWYDLVRITQNAR